MSERKPRLRMAIQFPGQDKCFLRCLQMLHYNPRRLGLRSVDDFRYFEDEQFLRELGAVKIYDKTDSVAFPKIPFNSSLPIMVIVARDYGDFGEPIPHAYMLSAGENRVFDPDFPFVRSSRYFKNHLQAGKVEVMWQIPFAN